MRTEQEMLTLLTETAADDSRIRAAYLEGSRTNPSAAKDFFQDYDVVYIVHETETFQADREWIRRFGEILYMQYPEDHPAYPADKANYYGWLMQFADGSRLDLHVSTWIYARQHLESYQVLVDKDGIFACREHITDQPYWIKRPDERLFDSTCNEFWWCLNNVAKGLWRQELPFVMDMLDFNIRPMLKQVLEWKIGSEHDFTVTAGKSLKYMRKYVAGEVYERFLSTYAPAETEAVWDAVIRMCDLFEETAAELSEQLGFVYHYDEGIAVRTYLQDVRQLPADADCLY